MQGTRIGAAFALMAGAGVLLGGAGIAEAAPPDFDLTNDGTTTSTSHPVTFNQFDPSFGTLTAVEINLTDPATGGAATVTITGGEGSATAQLVGTLELTGPGAATLFSAATSVTTSCTSPNLASTTFCTNTSGQNVPSWPPNPITVTSNLAAYTGTGTFDLVAAIDGVTNGDAFTGGGNNPDAATPDFIHTLMWSGYLTVTFDYVPTTAVPEPASLALLGIGLGGMWGVRRRRNC